MLSEDLMHRRHGAASIIKGYTVAQSQISHTFDWPSLQLRRDYLKCILAFMAWLQHIY